MLTKYIGTALICVNCKKCLETHSALEGIPLDEFNKKCECGCNEFEIVNDNESSVIEVED